MTFKHLFSFLLLWAFYTRISYLSLTNNFIKYVSIKYGKGGEHVQSNKKACLAIVDFYLRLPLPHASNVLASVSAGR
jgi:hypothetical protein